MLHQIIKLFIRSEKGGVLFLAALALIPLLGFTGLSIDVGRAYHARSLLANALDAAAVAAAKAPMMQAEPEATRIFNAYIKDTSLENNAQITSFTLNKDENYVNIEASSNVEMTFLKIIGQNNLLVGAASRVMYGTTTLEVALVLDNTGSMRHFLNGKSRMDHLKDASHLFLDIVFGSNEIADNLFVSIIPYITQVNSGPHEGWLTSAGQTLVNTTAYFPTSHSNGGWQGCFEARLNNGLSLTDTPPTDESTRFLPYFWPSTYVHNYPFPSGSVRPWGNYYGDNDWNSVYISQSTSHTPAGPNAGCPTASQPLTNVKQVLDDKIDEMFYISRGGTFVFEGLKWGWRNLSEKWQGLWDNTTGTTLPMPIGESKKIIILMTDGKNDWIGFNQPYYSYLDGNYTAYGRWYQYASHVPLNQNVITPSTLNDYTISMCNQIKASAAEYEIYTIVFGANSISATETMQACASDSDYFFEANSATELTDAFEKIAKRIQRVRFSWYGDE